MAGPEVIPAQVAHRSDRLDPLRRQNIKDFFPHRRHRVQIDLLSSILLRELNFKCRVCILHAQKQRRDRLPDLEIEGAVLDLEDHIIHEIPVQRLIDLVRSARTVGFHVPPVLQAVVHESPPDDDPAIGFDGAAQHVRAFGVRPAIGVRPGPVLAVRLDQEARQIGDRRPCAARGLVPECLDFRRQRVRRLQAGTQRKAEVDRNHQPHAERPEQRRKRRQVRKQVRQQPLRGSVHVDIVDAQHVDMGAGQQAAEIADALRIIIEPVPFKPNRTA